MQKSQGKKNETVDLYATISINEGKMLIRIRIRIIKTNSSQIHSNTDMRFNIKRDSISSTVKKVKMKIKGDRKWKKKYNNNDNTK